VLIAANEYQFEDNRLWEYHSDVISKPVTIEKQSKGVAKRHIGESLREFRRGGIKPGHL